jgi:cytosine/uracil/thiamine/allantoin permease
MLINFIKCIHVILALSLLGILIYCLFVAGSKKFALASSYQHNNIRRLNRVMMWASLFALVSGALLVHPGNFDFHTPWIQVAFSGTVIFAAVIGVMNFLKKKFSFSQRWVWLVTYSALILILVIVIRDAVTKSTLFL